MVAGPIAVLTTTLTGAVVFRHSTLAKPCTGQFALLRHVAPRACASDPVPGSDKWAPHNSTAAFGFETRSVAAVDDVANGVEALQDVAGRGSGLLVLLAEICLGGLLSPVGLASVGIFGLLYASGEFGSVSRFVAHAPAAREGAYYQSKEQDAADLVPRMTDFAQEEDGWARLRGGALRTPTLLPVRCAALSRGGSCCPGPQLVWATIRMARPPRRHSPLVLFGDKGGDVSKCPFFGGSNGGGLGDANIATALLFLASILLLRVLLLKMGHWLAAALSAQTMGGRVAQLLRLRCAS